VSDAKLCVSWSSLTSQTCQSCTACMIMVSSSMHMHVVHMVLFASDKHSKSNCIFMGDSVSNSEGTSVQYHESIMQVKKQQLLKLCVRGYVVIKATGIGQQHDVCDIHMQFKLEVIHMNGPIEQRQIGADTVIFQAIRAFKLYALMMPF